MNYKAKYKAMKKGGQIASSIMKVLLASAKAGVSTKELDSIAMKQCKIFSVKPAFLGYSGFPAAICTGVNSVVVHGIPRNDEILKEGDIVSIDFGIVFDGYFIDMARTKGIGKISKNAEKLINCSKMALDSGIKFAKNGNKTGDIGFAINQVAELFNFKTVTALTGHSIGKKLHEKPFLPLRGKVGEGFPISAGKALAIESMINEGDENVKIEKDGWTIRTVDGKLSALFEDTVFILENKTEILTRN